MTLLRHIITCFAGKGKLYTLPLLVVFIVIASLAASCDDEVNRTFSTREYVRCNYNVASYTELFGVMGNYGQFMDIRKMSNGKVRMTLASTGKYTEYQPDKIQQYFYFGLGGLIVGTNCYGESLCYDLSCPYCDAAAYRLSLRDNGIAKCQHCGISYDLNMHGVIVSVDSTRTYSTPRGLYRYRIVFDGTNVSMYN